MDLDQELYGSSSLYPLGATHLTRDRFESLCDRKHWLRVRNRDSGVFIACARCQRSAGGPVALHLAERRRVEGGELAEIRALAAAQNGAKRATHSPKDRRERARQSKQRSPNPAPVSPPVLPCTPKPPTRPSGKSNCLGRNPMTQAGERLGPSGALFARARCSFWPHFCSYFACRVARGSPGGQFSKF
jgi:hypothetical protein